MTLPKKRKPDKGPRGRQFQPGDKRPPGSGRAPGTPNKVTREVKDLCRNLVTDPDYLEALRLRLLGGELNGTMETTLWHYAFGKPKDTVAIEGGKDMSLNIYLADGSETA